jgi:domain.
MVVKRIMLTEEGLKKVEEELHYLKKVKEKRLLKRLEMQLALVKLLRMLNTMPQKMNRLLLKVGFWL